MESLLTGPLAGPLAGPRKLARQRTAPLILELDLTEGVIETRPPDPLSAVMTRHQPTITDVLAGLKSAREATERVAQSVTEQLAAAIAERKSVSPEEATRLITGGPYLADQALAAGLVDALGYRDEVYAAVRKQLGNDPILLYLGRYQR